MSDQLRWLRWPVRLPVSHWSVLHYLFSVHLYQLQDGLQISLLKSNVMSQYTIRVSLLERGKACLSNVMMMHAKKENYKQKNHISVSHLCYVGSAAALKMSWMSMHHPYYLPTIPLRGSAQNFGYRAAGLFRTDRCRGTNPCSKGCTLKQVSDILIQCHQQAQATWRLPQFPCLSKFLPKGSE